MKKKSLLIGLLVVAMSSAAFAQHVPVPDLASCPPNIDEFGEPVDWRFVPIPGINVLGAPDGPVNYAPIAGALDFCGITDIVFCSLAPVATLLPEVLDFANLVQCLFMDLNGPLDLEAEIPVSPNGIPDAQYELGILQALYNAGDAEVVAALQGNIFAIKQLVIEALIIAELKSDDKDIRGIVQAAAPYLVSSLSTVLAAFCTLGDEQTNAALDELLGLLSDIGLEPPAGGIGAITTGLPELGPDGDADNSGATNAEEYFWFVGVLEYSPAEYVAAALDPEQEPPAALTLTGPTKTVPLGGTFTLAVTANVGTPVSYAWSKDGTLLPLETGNQLVRNNAQVSDSGLYRVDVTVEVKDTQVYNASISVTVSEFAVPVGGAVGLMMLAGACALAGVAGLRRRK